MASIPSIRQCLQEALAAQLSTPGVLAELRALIDSLSGKFKPQQLPAVEWPELEAAGAQIQALQRLVDGMAANLRAAGTAPPAPPARAAHRAARAARPEAEALDEEDPDDSADDVPPGPQPAAKTHPRAHTPMHLKRANRRALASPTTRARQERRDKYAIEPLKPVVVPPDHMTMADICRVHRISESYFQAQLSRGEFPKADDKLGPRHLRVWKQETVAAAVAARGGSLLKVREGYGRPKKTDPAGAPASPTSVFHLGATTGAPAA